MLGIDWEAIAALLTSVAGFVAAYAALIRAKRETRKETEEECEQKLLVARKNLMDMSDQLYELHKESMKRRRK